MLLITGAFRLALTRPHAKTSVLNGLPQARARLMPFITGSRNGPASSICDITGRATTDGSPRRMVEGIVVPVLNQTVLIQHHC